MYYEKKVSYKNKTSYKKIYYLILPNNISVNGCIKI